MTRTWTWFLIGAWLALAASVAHGETVLITGANSGLGLEFDPDILKHYGE